jgi:hypothetical protein
MAGRTYKRDGNGRFAGGGGGGAAKGAGAKGAATKKANAARKAELVARGTSQLGRRVKAKGFEGGAAAQKRAGGLRTGGSLRGVYKDRGKAMGGAMKGRVKRDSGAAAKLAASRSAMPAKAVMAKASVAERKRAINKQVGELRRNGGGLNRLPAKTRYINSQNATARAETGFRGKGSKAARRMANGGAKPKAAPKPAPKPAKTSKAAPNKAKAAYKAATSQVRELKMYRGGKSDRVVKNAEAKVKRMETSRGAKKGAPKAVKTAAKVAAAVIAAGQTARAAMTSRRKR